MPSTRWRTSCRRRPRRITAVGPRQTSATPAWRRLRLARSRRPTGARRAGRSCAGRARAIDHRRRAVGARHCPSWSRDRIVRPVITPTLFPCAPDHGGPRAVRRRRDHGLAAPLDHDRGARAGATISRRPMSERRGEVRSSRWPCWRRARAGRTELDSRRPHRRANDCCGRLHQCGACWSGRLARLRKARRPARRRRNPPSSW